MEDGRVGERHHQDCREHRHHHHRRGYGEQAVAHDEQFDPEQLGHVQAPPPTPLLRPMGRGGGPRREATESTPRPAATRCARLSRARGAGRGATTHSIEHVLDDDAPVHLEPAEGRGPRGGVCKVVVLGAVEREHREQRDRRQPCPERRLLALARFRHESGVLECARAPVHLVGDGHGAMRQRAVRGEELLLHVLHVARVAHQ